MFSYAYQLKNKIELEEGGIGIVFLWDFTVDSSAVQHCTKFPSLITNVVGCYNLCWKWYTARHRT